MVARGELDLSDVAVVAQDLHRLCRLVQVDAMPLLEFLTDVVGEPVVPVDAAQFDVAVGRDDAEVVRAIFDDGAVEGASSKVVDENFAGLSNVGTSEFSAVPRVSEGRRRRFADDAHDVQAGDASGVLRRLAPRVVEVVGDRDNGVCDRTDFVLAVLLELTKNQGGDEFWGNVLPVKLTLVADGAHLPLDSFDDVFGIFHRRAASVWPDNDVTVFCKQDKTSRFDVVVVVWNWGWLALFVDDRQRRESGS